VRGTILRLARMAATRGLLLFLAVVVGVYLTVVIANMGGALDDVRRAEISANVAQAVRNNPAYQGLSQQEKAALIEELTRQQADALGLNRPFIQRSFTYLVNAMKLNLGWAEFITSDTGSRNVQQILLERLPYTLALFGTANLLLFFLTLFIALFLSRRYGSFLDKLTIALAPSSSAPGWFYGLFLILIFAAVLKILPWGGLVDAPVPTTTLGYGLSVAKHMVLPVFAVVTSTFFASIYAWRTFFLIYSSEDYVELARAKGISSRDIDTRYVLRPTLPPIITNFLLVLITMWMGQIVLETVFQWPGIGRVFYQSIQTSDTPVIIGVIVIFGYLLAVTVFALDFIYAIVDPRVRIGAGGQRR
jgi:peptide/nickel transport system permease protein